MFPSEMWNAIFVVFVKEAHSFISLCVHTSFNFLLWLSQITQVVTQKHQPKEKARVLSTAPFPTFCFVSSAFPMMLQVPQCV